MEFSDLRIFRMVVTAGGITRAAERLHRVQSNITTRIRKLEQELGTDLFLREGKRLQLSPAGQVFLPYADEMLALAERAQDALKADEPRGVLRLGAMESTAAVRLPGPLSSYHARYPDVAIELDGGAPPDLLRRVLAGELDAALVAEPQAGTLMDERLETLAVFDEQLVLVAAADHGPIKGPRDVSPRTALAFHPGCPHRDRLEAWFARDGIAVERLVEMASYHALLGCAVAGMGVALMPRSVLESYAERARLSVHGLPEPFRRAKTLLVWRRGPPQAKVARLADLLRPAGKAAKAKTSARP